MTVKIPYIIDELLTYRKGPLNYTKRFKELKHNKDLCPAVERQIESILDCFVRFHSVAYDIQGINDQGIDVICRYEVLSEDLDKDNRYTAFQIKSYDDLKKDDYLKSLKAQCFEAQKWLGESLDHYYLLICTSKIDHENKIRQIKQAFTDAMNVTVIDPTHMAIFLRLSPIRIKSVVTTFLKDDDLIYKRANDNIEEFTPTQTALYIAIVLEATFSSNINVDIGKIRENHFVWEIYSKVPDYEEDVFFFFEEEADFNRDEEDAEKLLNGENNNFEDRGRTFQERFSEDIDKLCDKLFSIDAASGMLEVYLDRARPIQAIMLDGMVRFDIHESDLINYVFTSLEVLERFGLDDLSRDE